MRLYKCDLCGNEIQHEDIIYLFKIIQNNLRIDIHFDDFADLLELDICVACKDVVIAEINKVNLAVKKTQNTLLLDSMYELFPQKALKVKIKKLKAILQG